MHVLESHELSDVLKCSLLGPQLEVGHEIASNSFLKDRIFWWSPLDNVTIVLGKVMMEYLTAK